MKMTLAEAIDMINHGETPEQYRARIRKIRKYWNERYELEDALEILTLPEDKERADKKRRRLEKVIAIIEGLQ